jgi:3-methylfumaryl-CoA hydratase
MNDGESPDLSAWIGRTETLADMATPGLVARLAATLDHDGAYWPKDALPPLGHWLCFLPDAAQSALDIDGHPKRGDFLPPIQLPRRMWAGSRVHFLASIPLGVSLRRVSTIGSVTEKTGRSGRMVFVTIRHEIDAGGPSLVREEQDLVYREATVPGADTPTGELPTDKPDWQASFIPDARLLFRYSALTFNAHRIHYDFPYATLHEGHAGLVVHGPLTATLLLDRYLQHRPEPINSFNFRAQLPLIAEQCLALAGVGNSLWACNADGRVAMRAEIR